MHDSGKRCCARAEGLTRRIAAKPDRAKRRGCGMTAIGAVGDSAGSDVGLLDRRRIIAGPGFNRWVGPPAALGIHLCIGMAYGFSVFWLPLSKALGHAQSIDCPGMPPFPALVPTSCGWRICG